MVFLVIPLAFIVWAATKFRLVGVRAYIPLAALIIFAVLLGRNLYDSAVYVDVHQLNGGDVGWFGIWAVPIFALVVLVIIADTIYILLKARRKSRKRTTT